MAGRSLQSSQRHDTYASENLNKSYIIKFNRLCSADKSWTGSSAHCGWGQHREDFSMEY